MDPIMGSIILFFIFLMPALKRSRRLSVKDVADFLEGKTKRRKTGARNEAKQSNISTATIYANPKFYNNLFPARQVRTLKYGSVISLNVSTGLGAGHVYTANGLFDPDITGTGHQPMGYDQMMSLYHHYTVTTARIKATMVHLGSAGGTPALCGIVVSSDTAINTMDTAEEFLEHPQRSNYKLSGSVTGEPATNQMNLQLDVAKFFGKTKSSMVNADLYRGAIGLNPAEQVYFHIMANSVSSADAGIVSFIVTIEYDVVFTEPKTLVQS